MSNRRISKKLREIPILPLCPAGTELVLFGIYENTRTGIRGIRGIPPNSP